MKLNRRKYVTQIWIGTNDTQYIIHRQTDSVTNISVPIYAECLIQDSDAKKRQNTRVNTNTSFNNSAKGAEDKYNLMTTRNTYITSWTGMVLVSNTRDRLHPQMEKDWKMNSLLWEWSRRIKPAFTEPCRRRQPNSSNLSLDIVSTSANLYSWLAWRRYRIPMPARGQMYSTSATYLPATIFTCLQQT